MSISFVVKARGKNRYSILSAVGFSWYDH
jgi:hypothetical protein